MRRVSLLPEDELEGALAHVKNRDVLIAAVAATLAGAVTYIAQMAQWAALLGGTRDNGEERGTSLLGLPVMAVVAPIAALLVQFAVSRAREFQADASGARLAGQARGLTSALAKLERASRVVPIGAGPAAAHLFIVNPLGGDAVRRLFSTHPPVAERIERLPAMRL